MCDSCVYCVQSSVCMLVCTFMSQCVCVCLYRCLWRPGADTRISFPATLHDMFWHIPSLSPEITVSERVAGQGGSGIYLSLQLYMGVIDVVCSTTASFSHGCWESKFSSSCLCGTHVSHWAISPALQTVLQNVFHLRIYQKDFNVIGWDLTLFPFVWNSMWVFKLPFQKLNPLPLYSPEVENNKTVLCRHTLEFSFPERKVL